jgi:hypothetical protein
MGLIRPFPNHDLLAERYKGKEEELEGRRKR